MTVAKARSRVAVEVKKSTSQDGPEQQERVQQARAELAEAKCQQHIQRVVAEAPPLTRSSGVAYLRCCTVDGRMIVRRPGHRRAAGGVPRGAARRDQGAPSPRRLRFLDGVPGWTRQPERGADPPTWTSDTGEIVHVDRRAGQRVLRVLPTGRRRVKCTRSWTSWRA